jgi:uracil-DNA glycosylase family 4
MIKPPLYDLTRSCTACSLRKGCLAPVPATGEGKIMLVGEGPGATEDKKGEGFTGDAGVYLDWLLGLNGIARADCIISNMVHCRPVGNKTPTHKEAEFCAERWLDKEIELLKPEIIVAMGAVAIHHFMGEGLTVEHSHGIPVQRDGYTLLPVWHPAAGFYDTSLMRQIQQDFQVLGKLVRGEEVVRPVDDVVTEYYLAKEVPDYIREQEEGPVWALDTETVEGKLWSIQLSDKPGRGIFWPVPDEAQGYVSFPILKDSTVVVHNYLYDAQFVGLPADTHDTMVMAYNLGLPQGLKELAWQLCGMEMKSYTEMVAGQRHEKAMKWLQEAARPGLRLPSAHRESDLETSIEADTTITESGERLSIMRTCLGLLLDRPGLTAGEVGDISGLGHPRVWRRISDLKNLELVYPEGERPWTNGRSHAIWWPTKGTTLDSLDEWPNPPELEDVTWNKKTNKLETKVTKPQHISKKIRRIIADVVNGKETKDGPTDPWDRWHKIDPRERAAVEKVLGAMPDASLADANPEEALHYSSRDPDATLRVYRSLEPRIDELGLRAAYEMDRQTLPIAREMMDNGIKVDGDYLVALGKHYVELMEAKAEEIFGVASVECSDCRGAGAHLIAVGVNSGSSMGYPEEETCYSCQGLGNWRFNPNSDMDLRKLFFEYLGFKPKSFTPTRLPKVSTDVLADIDHPVVPLVEEYRHLAHLKDSFCDTLPGKVDENGRIHTTIRVTRTGTGRWSMAQPNLQQIPVRTELGKAVRRAFQAEEENVLVAIDYSQIEMRVAAHLAQCQSMISLFHAGRDIHTETAAEVFGVRVEDVTSAQRYPTKTMGFGVLYGLTPNGLYRQMKQEPELKDWTERDCERFIKDYFALRPELWDWQEGIKSFARRNGYVRDMHGRIRWTPEMGVPIARIRAAGERQAVNFPVQGGAQGILKLAMGAIWRDYPRAWEGFESRVRWLLQIHDEILNEVDERSQWDWVAWASWHMERVVHLSVPVVVEAKVGTNWGEMSAVKEEQHA